MCRSQSTRTGGCVCRCKLIKTGGRVYRCKSARRSILHREFFACTYVVLYPKPGYFQIESCDRFEVREEIRCAGSKMNSYWLGLQSVCLICLAEQSL